MGANYRQKQYIKKTVISSGLWIAQAGRTGPFLIDGLKNQLDRLEKKVDGRR